VEDARVHISNLQPTRKIPEVRCYSSKINSQVSGSSKKIVDLSRNTPVIRIYHTSNHQASESIDMKKKSSINITCSLLESSNKFAQINQDYLRKFRITQQMTNKIQQNLLNLYIKEGKKFKSHKTSLNIQMKRLEECKEKDVNKYKDLYFKLDKLQEETNNISLQSKKTIKEKDNLLLKEKEYLTAIDDLKKENKGLKESNQYNCHKVIMLKKK
jgi:hypothetical protein